MKRAIIVQHMDHDHPGRFTDWFAEDGIVPDFWRVFAGEEMPNLAPYDLMFVLGGEQDTWQEDVYPYLAQEKAAIREWVWDRAKPYLGVCLGHQLLATALGGEVAKADAAEVGVFQVEIENSPQFEGTPKFQQVMEWHHAEVTRIPQSATVLASSSACKVQAMAIDSHALSTQFHCEFSPQSVAGWSSLPNYMKILERELGPGGYGRLKDECFPLMPSMAKNTRTVWENFRKLSGLKT